MIIMVNDMTYTEKNIKILEGLEGVRKRPAMYIGSTDKRGLHHLVWEIVDNAIDEVINGYGNNIKIIIHKDKSISIEDDGRGIPTGVHSSGKSTPEVIYTILHAGGKFEEGGYKVAGGLHGVGASVVNALSKWMEVTIKRDGKEFYIKFIDGGKISIPLKEIGSSKKTGTKVRFMPDNVIFSNTTFSFTTICERMQESAFLLKDLTIEIIDEEDIKQEIFHYENGLEAFILYINENKKQLHKVLNFNDIKDKINVNIAMQYTNDYQENILSFVNNVKTIDGGTHEVGFKSALTRVFNEYAKLYNCFKKDTKFDGVDVREGLTAIISIQIPESLLQFEGQTKSKLGTPSAKGIVEAVTFEKIKFFLEENKEIATQIIDKAMQSKSAREAAKKAREDVRSGKTKDKKEKLLSGKLTPAQGKDSKINELFLVEGDSAGGSAKTGRDRKYQAILPLRGKVINTEKASIDDIFKNEEINVMINTIGAGYGNNFDINDCNYNKVIIMTDADDDGAHIQVLLLTFFYRYMKPLIEEERLYIALAPLYGIKVDKEKIYAWTNEELEEIKENKLKGKSYQIQRNKGLGEMDPLELWNTTMNPDTRSLIKVKISDAALAEKRVSVLMGDKVEPRKEWIDENVEFSLEDDFKIK